MFCWKEIFFLKLKYISVWQYGMVMDSWQPLYLSNDLKFICFSPPIFVEQFGKSTEMEAPGKIIVDNCNWPVIVF